MTGTPPRKYYTFEVPSSWNIIGGVRVSNPENEPVSVDVEAIFHRQIIDSTWQNGLIAGLLISIFGATLLVFSLKKERQYTTKGSNKLNNQGRKPDLKYCSFCGTSIKADSKHCIKCGEKL